MNRYRVWRARGALSVLVGSIAIVACSSDTAMGVAQDIATSLSIVVNGTDPDQGGDGPLLLEVGDTISLAAVATNPLGLVVSTGPVTWSSTNTSVVQVDASGLVSATGPGTADIRAASGEAVTSRSAIVGDSAAF
jgi:hypothetical protein